MDTRLQVFHSPLLNRTPPYQCCAFCVYLVLQQSIPYMSFRRFFVASSLILSPLATIGFQSAALADSTTASVILSGTVAPVLSLQAVATAQAQNLPLSTPGQQVVKIADLTLNSNNYSGVTLTASSTNNGALIDQNNPLNNVQYQIDVVGDGGTPANFSTVSTMVKSVSAGQTDLYIRFNNPSVPKQGSYGDTITIIVADE